MGNQMSAITARDGSVGHDIGTDGSPHHGVQVEMTTTAPAAAAAAGGGATDHQEEEEADIEMAADPSAGSEEEANTPLHLFSFPVWIEVQISDILGSAGGGGGATDQVDGNEEFAPGPQPVQGNRDSGIFTSICAVTVSLAAAAFLRPTRKGLHSEDCVIVAYTLDLIMLLVLGILLFSLTLALTLVPDSWVSAVRAAATTVTVALLVLLLFLVVFFTYSLVRHDLP